MSSPILESLPAIHVTVIGVVAAFFSAFAVFAFQKVQDAKDKVEKTLKDAEAFGTPNNFIGGSQSNLLSEDGLLNWDACSRDVLHRATSMFSHLDTKAKYGYDAGYHREPSAEEVSQVASDLMLMLHYVFTTYPFNGKSMVHIEGITDKIEEQKKKPFDIQRLSELQSRISYLSWCWQTGHLSILEVANRYTAIKQAEEQQRRDEQHQRMLASIPEGAPQEMVDKMTKRVYEHPTNTTNFVEIVTYYFEKVMQYEQRVIPVLSEVLSEYKKYNERFKIKQWSLLVIKLIVFILIMGVCVPLVTLEILAGAQYFNWDGFLIGWFEHFVLLSTMCPYFYACWYFYSKLKKLSFQ
ncbi:hypothetical protein [Vibrio parahaemolyticus]|uniref:hypothetical protein n=1 Tax=Vibrio parahaemolyticus TaxID=670 RepID=UPI00111EB25A|nr:hypothetical protein [Vibrio parahaemolyticus]TNY70578.1 hypothetical protein CGK62_17825 [Vibrio parahaemolyticus]